MVVDIHVNDDSVEVANLWHVVSLYCSNGCKDKNNFAKLFAFAVKSNKTSREKSGKASPFFRPRAAGSSSVSLVSIHDSTASFLSGYLSVRYFS